MITGMVLAQERKDDFVKGADVGFLAGQEKRGVKFHDRQGKERECLELLKNDYQMSAIRLRVWVNPRGGDCDKNALLAMARRVKALGMDLMVDFHYSDWWADPAKQPIPKAWLGHSFEQMKQDLRNHTIEVLTLLKENGITPRWVQVGNETTNGMLWSVKTDERGWEIKDAQGRTTITHSMGHIKTEPQQYAGFIRTGYDAVKEVFPDAIVIVHLDRGHEQSIYDHNLDTILKYGGKFDMIGMSLYPYWAMEGHPELNADGIITDCMANIRHVSEKYKCDVMIVETGYEVDESHPEKMEEGRRQLTRVIREARNETNGHCRGVFYWEPQCLPGGYKLGAFDHNAAPTAIMEGFVESEPQTKNGAERKKLNFNADWRLQVGDATDAAKPEFDDSRWQRVTLPYAFNGDEAFRKDIVDLTDTIVWYRKTFTLKDISNRKVFVEFEGVRQGADFYLNGHHLGFSENGVMACGFDLTPYIHEGENVIAVRCDNSWTYRSREYDSRYQWNDRNFNANYGGIPKNVWLHVTDLLYQTLPLYSNLGTTGTYIYATDIDVANRKAVIHAESQVRNEDTKARTFFLTVVLKDQDGNKVIGFNGSERITLQPGETIIAKAEHEVKGLHFWSWGYGYLYTVETYLRDRLDDENDMVITRTGFRKTHFGDGKIWLNDRVMMVHGYAQRTSNEWPGVGISVPAWLSDYSNDLIVKSGGNMVRWMHVTPWKQDVESCDRVGLPQAMPAGDAEKDVDGPRWQQRTALMRDAIIYNRNNPSILFYESGNESISREHMLEMKAIRDKYDPHGGRAIGSREMLDIDEAEYGGEMLYINKSKKHPMWAMEYCRDEGLRKYWDEWSTPYHKEGDGPLYRGKPAVEYNHNMDQFAIEMVRRWYDYWRERPGTGTRVSSGGVKIVFSDTNTHHRGESNYRTSGVTDAMRIPKDAYFAHQVMWNGWVEPETPQTYIVGHWNYGNTKEGKSAAKPIYVVSNADSVELFLNGRSLGQGRQQYRYLFTFDKVAFEPGTLEAVGSNGSRYKTETAGEPYQLHLTAINNPEGTKADGADMVLFEVEVQDKQGRRCPIDNRLIHFEMAGEGKWIGGIASRDNVTMQRPDDNRPDGLLDAAATKNISDNYVGSMSLPVECGVNRFLVRTTTNAGSINISAYAEGLKPAYAEVKSEAVNKETLLPQLTLKSRLDRGETPSAASYANKARGIEIASAKAGCDTEHAANSYDDNELSEWKNDGRLSTAWITYRLREKAVVDDICIKLTGWRLRSYPLEIYAGKQLIWSGETERSLGYIHLTPTKQTKTDEITIRLRGAGKDKDAFGGIVEVAEPAAGELDLFKAPNGGDTKNELRIVEVEFIEHIK